MTITTNLITVVDGAEEHVFKFDKVERDGENEIICFKYCQAASNRTLTIYND